MGMLGFMALVAVVLFAINLLKKKDGSDTAHRQGKSFYLNKAGAMRYSTFYNMTGDYDGPGGYR
jgi:hypothetical protein